MLQSGTPSPLLPHTFFLGLSSCPEINVEGSTCAILFVSDDVIASSWPPRIMMYVFKSIQVFFLHFFKRRDTFKKLSVYIFKRIYKVTNERCLKTLLFPLPTVAIDRERHSMLHTSTKINFWPTSTSPTHCHSVCLWGRTSQCSSCLWSH